MEDGEEDDDDPTLTAGGRELFFNSNRSGNEDIWRSELSADAEAWLSPESVSELNTEERETGIAVSADGLSLWFSSDRDGEELDVFHASRNDLASSWSSPARVDELSGDDDDLVSSVGPDLLELYLARRSSSDDDYDLFVARRPSRSEPWSAPEPLVELNDDGEQSDAFSLRAGTLLLFTQEEEIVASERADARDTFGPSLPLADLNSSADDRDVWATAELDRVIFSSDRSGSYRLYQALRR